MADADVIPLHQNPSPEPPATPPPQRGDPNRKVAARWTPRLGEHFCAVSSYFLANYHRLKPHDGARGLNSSEVMLIVHLIDHKWDERAPYPSLKKIATRMGLDVRSVRGIVKRLEELGYLQRVLSQSGGPSKYKLEGLFAALEKLMDADVSARDQAEAAEA